MLPYLGAVFLGWSLGANDSANTFGTAVGTRIVSYRNATLLIALFVTIGAYMQGSGGIETLGKLTPQTDHTAVICLFAAAITVAAMTLLKLPVSTSQAAIGSIVGVGLMQKSLDLSRLTKVIVCWIGTPLGAIVICFIIYHVLRIVIRIWQPSIFVYDPVMRWALIVCGCYSAYALGANNVANVSAVLISAEILTPIDGRLFGGLAIALGALTFSRGVMTTVGKGIIKLDVFSSLCCVLSLAITVHIYAVAGVPVSTSQGIIGAVLGIGFVKGLQTVNGRMLVRVLCGWLATPFIAAAIAALLMFLFLN